MGETLGKDGEVGSLFSRDGETGHRGNFPRSGEVEELLRTDSIPKKRDDGYLGGKGDSRTGNNVNKPSIGLQEKRP